MAQFNLDVGGVPSANMPDQTGASRGIDTNRSFELLFKGIGDAVGGIATAVDNDIKNSIDKETRDANDSYLKTATDTVPSELKQSGAAIASLQAARDQGKVSDTYYYGQLVTLTKQMRAKYPGYEDYVDQTIQSVTGIRPANAYREALLSEIKSQQNEASDEAKAKYQWEKENEKYLGVIAPDYFDNPDKYDYNKVRIQVSQMKASDYSVQTEKDKLDLDASQLKANVEQVKQTAMSDLNQRVQQSMVGLGNTLGMSGNDFLKKAQAMAEGGFSPEEYQGLLNEFSKYKANMELQLNSAMTSPLKPGSPNSYSSIAPGSQKELVAEAMIPILAIEDLIKNKDFGLAGYYINQNAMITNKRTNELLNKYPELANTKALAEIDRNLASLYITQEGLQDGVFSGMAAEISARIVNGADTMNDSVNRAVQSNGDSKDVVSGINQIIDNQKLALTTGTTTPEQIKATVASLYALDDKGKDIFSYIDPAEYKTLYSRMFNAEMTNAIKTYGTPEDMQTYFNAAIDRIFSTPEFKTAAGSLNDTQRNWKNFFEVVADPNTGKLALNVKKQGVDPLSGNLREGPIGMFLYSIDKNTANNAINQMNIAFDTVGNIADAMGETDKVALYRGILKKLNVDLEQGQADSFFHFLDDAISTFMQGDQSAEGMQGLNDQINFTLPISETKGNEAPLLGPENPEVAQDLSQYLVKGQPASYINDLSSKFATSVSELINSAPEEIRTQLQIVSGARSYERQQQLWDAALEKYGSARAARKWVAPPGKSMHNHGEAIDWKYLTPEAKDWVHEHAKEFGLTFPLDNEPWHMEPSGARG